MEMKVVMIPWLAHGHITPFIELAKRLSTKNIQIYLCSTPINLSSIKKRIEKAPLPSNSITLVEFHLQSTPELPPHYHTTNGLPPHLNQTLVDSFQSSTPSSFTNLLKTLNPDIVIYDMHMPFAPTIALSLNIPAIQFIISPATTAAVSVNFVRPPHAGFSYPEIIPENLPKEPLEHYDKKGHLTNYYESLEKSSEVILVNSFRELEGKYIDYLPTLLVGKKRIVPVGPLVHDPAGDDDDESCKIMKWLGQKPESSTIYVSFGSECYLSKQEVEEIAHGLELSEINFIWVVRFPHHGEEKSNKTTLEQALPNGFLERLRGGNKGLVVDGWAPQAKILAHPSTGGFLSHCGWNSVIESIKCGVPIVAVPMLYEQPVTARLLEEVGVGLDVKKGKIDGIIHRDDLAQFIKRVMVEKDGEGTRMKAREFREAIRMKGEEQIDGLVEELRQLCKDSKFT